MSTLFYSVPSNMVQNVMSGTQLHTPQSVFQPMMNHQNINQEAQVPWMPWNVPGVPRISMPWAAISNSQQPDLVQFSYAPVNLKKSQVRGKRKWEIATTPDVVDFHPRKQFITEEKMTQHFQDMHISSNALNAQKPGPSTSTASRVPDVTLSSNSDIDLTNTIEIDENSTQPRLVISEELKNLQSDPILPSSLLSKLERPSMALVLWEPPSKHLSILPTPRNTPTPSLMASSENNNNNGINNNENNNNESVPDLNQTMDINVSDPTLEPMDL